MSVKNQNLAFLIH